MPDSEPQFVPVQIGSMVIRDPMLLKTAFPDTEAYTALMEYFPATKGQPPLQSMPDDVAETLIRAFKQRIQGLGSISPARMSKINGSKSALSITNLVHMITLLQGRKSTGQRTAPAKRLRKKIILLPPDKKRELIFKLLWDLLHPTTDRGLVAAAWDTILEDITSKAPYSFLLQAAADKNQPIAGDVDLGALGATDEGEGRSRFTKSSNAVAAPVSPAEQLKVVFALSHLFNLKFDDAKTPKVAPLIMKLADILNAYTGFYATRFPALIKTGFLSTFYNDLDKKLFNVDTLLTLYKSITTIQRSNIYPSANDACVMIKVSGFNKNIQDLIKKYSEAVIGKGKTKTNQTVRDEGINSELRKLYSINVLDTKVIQIIAGSRPSYKINAVPDAYKEGEKELLAKNKDQIATQVKSYFGDDTNSTLYVIITPSNLIQEATVTEPIIQRLYTYTATGTVTDGIVALQQEDKAFVPLIATNKAKYIDVTYKPTQVYQSFTLPILQLLVLTHLKAQLASP
jgi:hypothetical protein